MSNVEEARIRPFTDTLRDLRYGEAHEDLSKQLNDLVAAVSSTGIKGELILKLKIKPTSGNALEVTDEIVVKKPTLPKGSSLMFPTPQFNLSRKDSRQMEIEGLRAVGGTESQPLKEVGNG